MQCSKETSPGNDRPDKRMQTSLSRIVEVAKQEKKRRFRALYSLLNKTNLRVAYYSLNKNAAPGIDRISFSEYGENLEANLDELVSSLKEKRYRAKLIRRVYIPKAQGKLRPLGIPAISDKILQYAVAQILSSIYEVDFLDTSFGYRPKKDAHKALYALRRGLLNRKSWVVEADIKSFFDNINHKYMIKMLMQRVDDRALLKLIWKWLKAGIMETTGKVLHPTTGTPQGGIVSPVLANIYLHYVLDLWHEKRVTPACDGGTNYTRYADDYVATFQNYRDAKQFMQEMKTRLQKFNLELAPDKTRLLMFDRFRKGRSKRFSFLGFEFWWGTSQTGKDMLMHRTATSRFRQSVLNVKEWCKANRNKRIRNIFTRMNRKLTGYYNYFGVEGNFKRIGQFYQTVIENLFKWLNRRSQRRSFNWKVFSEIVDYYGLKQPKITKSLYPTKGVSFA